MVDIRLSKRELALFGMCLGDKVNKNDIEIMDTKIIIRDNELSILESIISVILSYFLDEGLNKNDEPNKLGLELEDLNSIFIREARKIRDQVSVVVS